MKLFGWMQNKFNGKQGISTNNNNNSNSNNTRPNAFHSKLRMKQESREEFSDWPHSLLAIGTLGNNEHHNVIKREQNQQIVMTTQDDIIEDHEETSSPDELKDFTPEEIGKLQKELTKLLSKKQTSKDQNKEIANIANLPLDKFLNCPSSLELSRRMSNYSVANDQTDLDREDDIERTISVIIDRCKDICETKKKKAAIGKKSISFLFTKMFVCTPGFAPQPSLRDTFQESRMEKLLKTLLLNKINPQKSPRSSSMKEFIEDKKTRGEGEEYEKRHKTSHGSKWDKTDSEYIVLEI